jgi:hypothetical protein
MLIVNFALNRNKTVYSWRPKNVPFPKEIRIFEFLMNKFLFLLYKKFAIVKL